MGEVRITRGLTDLSLSCRGVWWGGGWGGGRGGGGFIKDSKGRTMVN